MKVGELAETVGIAPDTVRYYEKVGLLPAPKRTASGYRAYADTAVDRLRFIQGAQRIGLPLNHIRDLPAVPHNGVRPCEPAEQLLPPRPAELLASTERLAAPPAAKLARV